MNISELHQDKKPVTTASIFKTAGSSATSIQIQAKEQLKKHISKVPALLICISGNSIYQDTEGKKLELSTGDYVNIEPDIEHWIDAQSTSTFVLIR